MDELIVIINEIRAMIAEPNTKCDKLNNDLEPSPQIDTLESYPMFQASEIRVSLIKSVNFIDKTNYFSALNGYINVKFNEKGFILLNQPQK